MNAARAAWPAAAWAAAFIASNQAPSPRDKVCVTGIHVYLDQTLRKTERGEELLMHYWIVIIPFVLLSAGAFGKPIGAEALGEDSRVGSYPAPDEGSGRERFRFIGVPAERNWYYSFDPQKPPPAEGFDPRPFLLVNVLQVISGHPPVDEHGLYQHVGLDLLVLGGRYPVPGLTYEFIGYSRRDLATGAVLFEEEECLPLWGRWLAWLALYAAVILALVVILYRCSVLLVRRLRNSGDSSIAVPVKGP